MKKIILEKLAKVVNSGIDTQEKTLYLFVQIHKIRKLDGASKSCLDFFRDWLVHDEISYKPATDFFLNRFDQYVSGNNIYKIAQDFKSREKDFFKRLRLTLKSDTPGVSQVRHVGIFSPSPQWVASFPLPVCQMRFRTSRNDNHVRRNDIWTRFWTSQDDR